MYISNKIRNIFNNLEDTELKQLFQLMIDEKPEESGLLSLIESKKENALIKKQSKIEFKTEEDLNLLHDICQHYIEAMSDDEDDEEEHKEQLDFCSKILIQI